MVKVKLSSVSTLFPTENGFVSHYNVQFEHGIVENVSVEDMDILTMEAHGEHVEHEGETIAEAGGIVGALKKVVKTVIGPADQSPKAEEERMDKRRGPANSKTKVGLPNKQQPANMKEDADVFDLVKGHLMDEGLSEKEALEKMLTLLMKRELKWLKVLVWVVKTGKKKKK